MEDIKKAIEEGAFEEARYNPNDPKYQGNWYGKELSVGIYNGFIKGANFILSKWEESERWRKVEDNEYPENDNQILVKLNTSELAFARYIKGKFRIESDSFGKRVIEWQPINK